MAARITGGRAVPRYAKTTVSRTASGQRERAENRRLAQLVVCGGAFVLLVAGKLLLPERAAPVGERLEEALNRNMDVQSVFSALGRGLAGTPGTAEEVWQAVFQPEGMEASAPVDTNAAEPDPGPDAALESLRAYRDAAGSTAGTGNAASGSTENTGSAAAERETVLYTGKDLPDRVSMEQAILGFDYCTPVLGALTSGFGWRKQPGTGEEKFHYGLDLAAEEGTGVLCFAAGTVTAVGDSTSYGKYCIVAHGGGFSTLYAHCSQITVTAGQGVSLGQEIGRVGQTGNATGPHLHLELQKENTYYNPIYYVAHN